MDFAQLTKLAADLSGVPGLRLAASLALKIWNRCEAMSSNKQACSALRYRCVRLILHLRDNSQAADGLSITQLVDGAISLLEKIARTTDEWSKNGPLTRFIVEEKISQGLVALNKDLDDCMSCFMSATLLEVHHAAVLRGTLQERNSAEQTALLLDVLLQVLEIRKTQLHSYQTEELMATVQEDMRNQETAPEAHRVLGERLHSLWQLSGTLPPLPDLKGQLVKIQSVPVSGGNSSDVWIGIWLGKEKVAMKVLRAFRVNPEHIKRFEREATLCRELKHDNVLPCYGFASDQGPSLALISPWMENRDAMVYIGTNPGCDRRKILRGAARGLDYLHRKGVVHGDVRGKNILIDINGEAKIFDFGLAGMLHGGIGNSASIPTTIARWIAPELMLQSPNPPDTRSDIFSYGRTILEVLTGEKPFYGMESYQVVLAVSEGAVPERPRNEEVVQHGLTGQVWEFLLQTWEVDPPRRPTMRQVLDQTDILLWE